MNKHPSEIKEKADNVFDSMFEGMRYIFRNKTILGAVTLDLFAVLFGGIVAVSYTHLDVYKRQRNTYYDDLISGNILQVLKITKLQKNAFQEYAKSEGKLGGQNKIPRLANDRKIGSF